MRLAVLSDTHGVLPALEAVLAEIDQVGVDGIIDAGDLVGGPYPGQSIRLLQERGAWMIRGNTDRGPILYAAGEGPVAWRSHRQFDLLRWACRHLDEGTLALLASLPEERVVHIPRTAPIRVVHGSPGDPGRHLIPSHDPVKREEFRGAGLLPEDRPPERLDAVLEEIEEPVLICGHSHIPWVYEAGGRMVLNPGSVAGPLNGRIGAHYALLTWADGRWRAEQRVVSYEIDRVRAAFGDSGLLHEGGPLARTFLLSIENGRNVAEDFLSYARSLDPGGGRFISDAAWEEAAATYDWAGAAAGRLAYLQR